MAELIIYTKNGGKIYVLVMAQKMKAKQEENIQEQEALIKSLRETSSSKYGTAWNNNLIAIKKGHKTGLYKELRRFIG
mgnify:CR=1 FL=1